MNLCYHHGMRYTATLNKSGQATLPRAVAKLLGIEPGMRFYYEVSPDQKTVTIQRQENLLESIAKVDAIRAAAIKRDPKIAQRIKEQAGLEYEDIIALELSTPEGRREFEEEHGVKL